MRIALVHNYYQQPGGEDTVFETERALLERAGHRVGVYTRRNDEISRYSVWQKLGLLKRTVWADDSARAIGAFLQNERPEVVHFHNTFPLVSPAAYYVVQARGIPVVQTLHNFRIWCLNGLFFRDGQICEDCLGKFAPWPGIIRGTYRSSRPASGLVAAMLTTHRVMKTWTEQVDIYIATTEFARAKFIQGGLPADRVVVKSNCVYPDPGPGEGRGGYALFAGRLAPEKGVEMVLAAWQQFDVPMPLKIAGEGPLASKVARAAGALTGVEWLGWLPRAAVLDLMKEATVLLVPSFLYENCVMVIAEAFATGLPVIASNLGSMASLIDHGRTGLHVRPGDAADLASKVAWTANHPVRIAKMRREARREFEERFSPQHTYQALMQIYTQAMARAQGRRWAVPVSSMLATHDAGGAGSNVSGR